MPQSRGRSKSKKGGSDFTQGHAPLGKVLEGHVNGRNGSAGPKRVFVLENRGGKLGQSLPRKKILNWRKRGSEPACAGGGGNRTTKKGGAPGNGGHNGKIRVKTI